MDMDDKVPGDIYADTITKEQNESDATWQSVKPLNSRLSVAIKNKSENIRSTAKTKKIVKKISNEDLSSTNYNKNVGLHKSQQQIKKNGGTASDVKVLSNKRIVVIVAYMRTGSTFTASLLQEYKNTFYVFEPIRYLFTKFRSKYVTLKYLNGTSRHFNNTQKRNVVLSEIMSWLTCQIDDISVGSLTDSFHYNHTKYMKGFNICYNNAKKQNSKYAINKCLLNVKTKCHDSTLLVLKFIRLRMQDAVKLLPYFPNMKIIHLVRDPRGILSSRIKIKEMFNPTNVRSLCSMVKDDLEVTKAIHEKFQGRIKIVYYEDMATRPFLTSKAISSFSGIDYTEHMQSYIESQTSASFDSCPHCTARANSALTARKWRNELDPKYASYIYKTCESSNKYLGYLPFSMYRDQKNFNIPSRKKIDLSKNSLMLLS